MWGRTCGSGGAKVAFEDIMVEPKPPSWSGGVGAANIGASACLEVSSISANPDGFIDIDALQREADWFGEEGFLEQPILLSRLWSIAMWRTPCPT